MSTTVYRQLQIRRDVEANLPTLAEGEFFFSTDTHKVWIGSSSGNIRIF